MALCFMIVLVCFGVQINGEEIEVIGDTQESFACTRTNVITPTCAHYTDKYVINPLSIKYGYLPGNHTCTNETRGCEDDISRQQFQDAMPKMSGRQQSDPYRFPINPKSQVCPESNYTGGMSYMIARYNCVDASKIQEICSRLDYTSEEIYIWNDGYPDQGEQLDTGMCECAVNISSDAIDIYTLYADLDCSQNLTLQDTSDNSSEIFVWDCKKKVYKQEYTSLNIERRNLTLTWYNNYDESENRTGKYWIKLKAVNGTIRIKCPLHDPVPETTQSTVAVQTNRADTSNGHGHVTPSNTAEYTADVFSVSGAPENTTVVVNNIRKDKSQGTPNNMTIIIGASAGGAVFIVIIVIVVVCRRRQNAAENKMVERGLSSIRNEREIAQRHKQENKMAEQRLSSKQNERENSQRNTQKNKMAERGNSSASRPSRNERENSQRSTHEVSGQDSIKEKRKRERPNSHEVSGRGSKIKGKSRQSEIEMKRHGNDSAESENGR